MKPRATWRCSSTIDGELESNEFNTQLLFDSLVSNNKLDYAQKIGFLMRMDYGAEAVFGRNSHCTTRAQTMKLTV